MVATRLGSCTSSSERHHWLQRRRKLNMLLWSCLNPTWCLYSRAINVSFIHHYQSYCVRNASKWKGIVSSCTSVFVSTYVSARVRRTIILEVPVRYKQISIQWMYHYWYCWMLDWIVSRSIHASAATLHVTYIGQIQCMYMYTVEVRRSAPSVFSFSTSTRSS